MKESTDQIEKVSIDNQNVMFVGRPSWIPGILGLVAARLAEQFYKPAIAASGEGDIVRASARSIPEFNLIESFKQFDHLFERYGGHSMAAGFTIKREKLKTFRQSMTEYAGEHMNNIPSSPTLELEDVLDPSNINRNFLDFMTSLDPFGSINYFTKFIAQ